MKVADVMSGEVEFVDADTTVADVSRIIFGRGINGVPVVKNKKVIGFVTERDILTKFYPTIEEYLDDPIHTSDFEEMEKKVPEILSLRVDKIMSKKPMVVTPKTPLLRAQSLMFVNKVGRLPVVDEKGNLVGIVSKSDIFKAVVGDHLPFEEDEKFHDWLSRRYNLLIDWDTRLSKEIPDLVKLFKQEGVRTVLDLGSGTGRHSMALAKEGFQVVGLDRSSRMSESAKETRDGLTEKVKKNVRFVHHEYKDLDTVLQEEFDAVIIMGTGLAHEQNPEKVLKEVSKVLKKKAVFFTQITNFEKVIQVNKRLFDFNIRKSQDSKKEHAFLRYYDPLKGGVYTLNVAAFDKGPTRWVARGMNSVHVSPIDQKEIKNLLHKIGFDHVSYYGGENGFYYDSLLQKPFKPLVSDVMHVVAKR